MNLLRPTLAAFTLVACGLGRASEPVPNVTVVCEIHEISPEERPELLTPSKGASPTGLMVLTAQNGVRCVTQGLRGTLDYFPIVSEDHSQITLSGTAALQGSSTPIEMTSPLDTSKFLETGGKAGTFFLRQCLQNTRASPGFEPQDKVTISCERITMPVAKAAHLVKPEKGHLDLRLVHKLASWMVQAGSAQSQITGPLRIPYGQMEKVTEGGQMLMVDPQASEDRRRLTISFHLKASKSEIISTLNIRNGDSVLVGTLETENPEKVTLVFLHTAPTS